MSAHFGYTERMRYEIRHIESIDSTNTALKRAAKDGAPSGTVLVADRQTAGRGRLGRSFYSPAGSGLYVSILLRPAFIVSPAALTCMSAVALADVIRSYGRECSIKWVNDIYCNDKKAAGILTEGTVLSDGSFAYAVVGIGVNLSLPPNVPSELEPILSAVFDTPTDLAFRDAFLHRLLERFGFYWDRLPDLSFLETYNALQNCFGRRVSFLDGNRVETGVATGIDRAFRLIVQTEYGSVALERGEVTFL